MSDMDFKKRPESKAKGRYKSRIPEGTSIFPISLQIKRGDGKFEYGSLGTGFFVSKFGLFLTAKHVVEDQLHYQNGNGLEAWVVIKNKNYACPIKNIQLHTFADIAFGFIVPPDRNSKAGAEFGISLCQIGSVGKPGSQVLTYGYGRTQLSYNLKDIDEVVIDMVPDYYDGKIIAHLPCHPRLKDWNWPLYEHSISIASGMSGGPVMLKDTNRVIAVNTSGWSTEEEDIEGGFATDVNLALDMVINADIPLFKGRTLRDLLKAEKQID